VVDPGVSRLRAGSIPQASGTVEKITAAAGTLKPTATAFVAHAGFHPGFGLSYVDRFIRFSLQGLKFIFARTPGAQDSAGSDHPRI
jgi:hypothetical protein